MKKSNFFEVWPYFTSKLSSDKEQNQTLKVIITNGYVRHHKCTYQNIAGQNKMSRLDCLSLKKKQSNMFLNTALFELLTKYHQTTYCFMEKYIFIIFVVPVLLKV